MPLQVHAVSVEHHREALGIGEATPRISWQVVTDEANWVQHAYQLRIVVDGVETISPEVRSADSILQPWPIAPLASRAAAVVQVRVWGPGAIGSDWSPPAVLETGLLDPADWAARLISPDWTDDPAVDHPPTLFRREFDAAGEIASARLYLTAHGVVEAEINGVTIGDDVLAPGWSSYRHRLRYFTYDVTSLLRSGPNAIGATVADGWFRGLLGFEGGRRNVYGERLALLAQLEIRYHDGSSQTVATDSGWRAGRGPIRAAGIYPGETYDARLELPGWTAPGFDDRNWTTVSTDPAPVDRLVAPPGPAVRRIEEIRPVSVSTSPLGHTIVDFGQNLVGRLRIRVAGDAGHQVTLRHAEVLEHGELGTRPLRVADATDRYILRGGGVEVWEPRFTYHGFRYAEINGWPGPLDPADITAVVLHTDLQRTGWFSCSDELLNRLHDNVVWGMRGNFLDLPTDCPQRDERLGWTGDIQVFTPTARFLYDCTGMLTSWLDDVAAEQRELGTVPVYVPYLPLGMFEPVPVAAWGDAAVVVPWMLFRRDGDLGLLRRHYPLMTAWVDQITAIAGSDHLWDSGFQLGDWLDPTAPPDDPAAGRTDPYLVATGYHAYTAGLVAAAAEALDLPGDHRRYRELAAAVRAAFAAAHLSTDGALTSDSPTAYAMALSFGLIPPTQRAAAGRRLVELVRADDHRIGTGFVGTPIICDALSDIGEFDTAYQLLTQRQCPSWLYPVTMGATTIWERWDSMLPDGSINPGDMTSFNHYALGAVADWLHRTVGGLSPDAPGYRRILVAPRPGGGLTRATVIHDTPYGMAEVSWYRDGDQLTVEVLLPPGTTATVQLPDGSDPHRGVGAGRHTYRCRFRPAGQDPVLPVTAATEVPTP